MMEQSARSTSALLGDLAAAVGAPRITIAEIVVALRNRAYGMLLIVFGAPCLVAAPPPVPMLCGVVVVLVAANMVAGRLSLWLPGWLARRDLPRATLARLIRRILPTAIRIERYCRPRLFLMSARAGRRLVGAMLLALGIVVILPISVIGNVLPGLAIVILGMGLSQRDGMVIGAGLLLGAAALAASSATAWAALRALSWAT